MRIIAGRFRGTQLVTLQDNHIRPTSDRVREALFNKLSHGIDDFEFQDARVIDLFAGTGALALEAISRGAAFALLVDDSTTARATIRRNVERLSLTGQTKIFRRDATRLGPFNLAFIDPPYDRGLGELAMQALADGGWLTGQAICVLEERRNVTLQPPPPFTELNRRDYGDTQMVIYRFDGIVD